MTIFLIVSKEGSHNQTRFSPANPPAPLCSARTAKYHSRQLPSQHLLYCTVLYCAVLYCAVRYCTVLYPDLSPPTCSRCIFLTFKYEGCYGFRRETLSVLAGTEELRLPAGCLAPVCDIFVFCGVGVKIFCNIVI